MKSSLSYITPSEAAQELHQSKFGAHFLVIYQDLLTFREMYSYYVKVALNNNEIVLILPFYETTDSVKRILSEGSACIDVKKHEKEQSLLIMDSLKAYSLKGGLIPFVNQTVKFAKTSGKNGVTVLADMGSFFYNQKSDGCMHYEMTLPTQYEGMNLKGFCIYHKKDYERRFSENDRRKLSNHHGKSLILLPTTRN